MQKIISGLEEIARTVKTGADASKTAPLVSAARSSVAEFKKTASEEARPVMDRLDVELSAWQMKLEVILNEPVGRQGMAKHAHYWVEELKKFKVS